MQRYQIWLARAETSLAVLTGVLGVLTPFWRDWIEVLTGWNPDHHSGSAEYALVAVLLVASLSCAAAARVSYRRLAATVSV
jgi:hypothetical protein